MTKRIKIVYKDDEAPGCEISFQMVKSAYSRKKLLEELEKYEKEMYG